ncbi:hypothetical protein Asppvi_003428 [Aspergillus pseudoviridinutans]|uniref:Uncharacterized protein n=1 Tax=Aspergillus pseudoviridinutans TaxID=1517512 RepID=A0A9P3EQU5_9EURO|nr:uncharacterized protein Asppvi_003428 [Aspergillus pseudoviridinutans]GIJ84581.1 hypothetical protein Asppvi_003428 [Aspergillus pseudoviridinutans]
MACFGGQSAPSLRPLPGSRPDLLKRLMLPPALDILYEQIFWAEINTLSVAQLDEKFVALLTWCHTDTMQGGMLDEYNEADAFQGPQEVTSDLNRVWKTTAVYELIAEDHPPLVRFDHRDPFFGIPILNIRRRP